jgi:hypothetical protein
LATLRESVRRRLIFKCHFLSTAREIRNLGTARRGRTGTQTFCFAPVFVIELGNRYRFATVSLSSAERMLKVKDTLRATVNLTFDGRVIKNYHGPDAHQRFTNEVRVLRHLAAHGCHFVPRLLDADEKKLRIITNNCGTRVEHLDPERQQELFAELEKFGVRHDDADLRNVTYRQSDGCFCLIDFEFATLLPSPAA